MVDVLSQPTVFFAMVLALALLVERAIEMVKILFDYLDFRLGWDKHWSRRAEKLHTKLKNILGSIMRSRPELQKKVLKRYENRTLDKTGGHEDTVVVISGDKIRVIATQVFAKLLGISFGILLACYFKIDLFTYVDKTADLANETIRTILSGIAIGLGSAPIHKIITTIERARKKQKEKIKGTT